MLSPLESSEDSLRANQRTMRALSRASTTIYRKPSAIACLRPNLIDARLRPVPPSMHTSSLFFRPNADSSRVRARADAYSWKP